MIHVKVWWLWENNTSFLLQHITSRGTRPAPLEQRGAHRHRYLLREDEPSARLLPRPSGRFQPWSDVGWGYWEDSIMSLLDDAPLLFDHLLPQQIELCAFDPVSCTRTACSFMVHSGPLPQPFFLLLLLQLSCSQPQGHSKTSRGVVNVLIMQRPGDGSMHTLKHGSLWQTKMLLLIFPQMEHIKRRAEPFALWS